MIKKRQHLEVWERIVALQPAWRTWGRLGGIASRGWCERQGGMAWARSCCKAGLGSMGMAHLSHARSCSPYWLGPVGLSTAWKSSGPAAPLSTILTLGSCMPTGPAGSASPPEADSAKGLLLMAHSWLGTGCCVCCLAVGKGPTEAGGKLLKESTAGSTGVGL